MQANIAVLEGDGIGPEIMREGLKVLNAIEKKYSHQFSPYSAPFGAQAYFNEGSCFPDFTKKMCRDATAILKGPVGLDAKATKELKARGVKMEKDTVLALREMFDSYCNYRPVTLHSQLADFSPLRAEFIDTGLAIMMMRELTGGIYFGKKEEGVVAGKIVADQARDDCVYTKHQIKRFAHACFTEADKRKTSLTNVHKANVLATSRLWNACFTEVAHHYQHVPFREMLVDSLATALITNPTSLNGVLALENLQGDIITDQGGGIIGSLGLMPSACINPETGKGYFEPAHGSAPDIAGKGIANPYSMIGSVAFMLQHLGLENEARDVLRAQDRVFAQGYRTRELSRILSNSQKRARVQAAGVLFPAFTESMGYMLTREEFDGIVTRGYEQHDREVEKKVILTSQFGDKVVENILEAA